MNEATAETERGCKSDRNRGDDRSDSTRGPAARSTSRADWRGPIGDNEYPDNARVLVITGLGRKNNRHYGPLANIAGETTLVSLDPDHAGDINSAAYVTVPDVGPRILRVVLLFFVALYEGYRNEYDSVASISLLPYGLYALALKAVYGYQAHLGIIGIDIDHHAEQWYGLAPRWAFRRFDAVSVPGSTHAERLVDYGVRPERIQILTNSIDTDTYNPIPADIDTEYDFVWVGRFSAEKDPVLFVRALAELESRGHDVRAVMVGDGALRTDVVEEIAVHSLEDSIDFAGWVDEPLSYYRQSDAFVLTSRRDALPLAMLEAMAAGLAPIVPQVGSVSDIVTDGQNGIVVPDRSPASFVDAMARCLEDADFREAIADNAPAVRESVSMDDASDDWRRILATLADAD